MAERDAPSAGDQPPPLGRGQEQPPDAAPPPLAPAPAAPPPPPAHSDAPHPPLEEEEAMGHSLSSPAAPHLTQLQSQLEHSLALSRVSTSTSALTLALEPGWAGVERPSPSLEALERVGQGGVFASSSAEPAQGDKESWRGSGRRRGRSAGQLSTPSRVPSGLAAPEGWDDGAWSGDRRQGKRKTRPASALIPTSTWAAQLSQLAFPSPASSSAKKGRSRPSTADTGSSKRLSSLSPSRAREPVSAGLATPPRARKSSSAPSPRLRQSPGAFPSSSSSSSPSASSNPFRASLRLPFLPSIPASPLPLGLAASQPAGMTRSQSSPPILPALSTGGPLSPSFATALALEITPPTAALDPPRAAGWPEGEGAGRLVAARTTTSASAPNLTLLTHAPIPDGSPAGGGKESPYFPPTATFAPVEGSPSPGSLASASPGAGSSAAPSPSSSATATATVAPPPRHDSLSFDPALLIHDDDDVDEEEVEREREEKAREKRRKDDEKRYHALVELVETERGYLEGLRVLVKIYFPTLPFLGTSLLSLSDVHSITRNADRLLDLHERIGGRIDAVEQELGWRVEGEGEERARRTRDAAGRIARVFEEELPNFSLYNDFCARHPEALDLVRGISSRQEWEAYERQCASRAAAFALGLGTARGDTTPIAARADSAAYPFFPPPATASPGPSPLPFSASPASSAAPSTATSTAASPSHSSSAIPTLSSFSFTASSVAATPSSVGAASSAASAAASARSKLRFTDYAISPVQRVTRYPLVFGQLAKYFSLPSSSSSLSSPSSPSTPTDSTPTPETSILATWHGVRSLASGVDAAKRQREGEQRTRVVAQRMDFATPLAGGAFCDLLGPTLLVGALHVVRSLSGEGAPAGVGEHEVKVRYWGCFLYRTHVVMAKIRKRAVYEPREWLPLRLFEISDVDEGQGLLSHSIRLTFRDHVFELGSLCASEKAVWLSHLLSAQKSAREMWDAQERDEHGQPTLFDDTLVSSVPTASPQPASVPLPSRRTHSRTASTASVGSLFSSSTTAPPSCSTSPQLSQEEPLPPLPADFAHPSSPPSVLSTSLPLTSAASAPFPPSTTHLARPSRFSTTASSLLLGRTPSSQRAAVDLRLGDVFSADLLSARAHSALSSNPYGADDSSAAAKRARTASGPKRSMTALTSAALPYAPYVVGASTAARMLSAGSVGAPGGGGSRLERRRMSSVEVGLGASDRAEFRGAIGFDASREVVYRDEAGFAPLVPTPVASSSATGVGATPEKGRWAGAMRRGKGSLGHSSGAATLSGTSSGTGTGAGRTRPSLPEIDTALAESIARSASASRKGLATPKSAGGSWSRRSRGGRGEGGSSVGGAELGGQLRRVASHNSIQAQQQGLQGVRTPLPTMLVLPHTPEPQTPTLSSVSRAAQAQAPVQVLSTAVDVERNNSVSSSASSNETGPRSSSSHAYSALVETPPSSIPPSPDFATVELDPLARVLPPPASRHSTSRKPSFSSSPSTPQSGVFPSSSSASSAAGVGGAGSPAPRAGRVSLVDGMSSVFRLRRRKSTLGLVPPAVASPSMASLSPASSRGGGEDSPPGEALQPVASHVERERDSAASKAAKLQRRASTTLSGLLTAAGAKKRAQSSPSLAGPSGFFGSASSSHLPLSSSPSSSYGSPPTSGAPSAATSPATSPPGSAPPTPAGGTVVDLPLAPASASAAAPVATPAPGLGLGLGKGRQTGKARRGFFAGMTPMHAA
ncbi:hypothetical protein JCM10207_006255 [Rhodosporidiobolus poonsookiae]